MRKRNFPEYMPPPRIPGVDYDSVYISKPSKLGVVVSTQEATINTEPHENDRQWVEDMIKRLPRNLQQPTATQYLKALKEAYATEAIPHKRWSAARTVANTRLRVYVEKVIKK